MVSGRILLDTRRETKKGFPVKFRLYENGRCKYIPLEVFSSEDGWDGQTVNVRHPKCSMAQAQIARRSALIYERLAESNKRGFDLDQTFRYIQSGGSDDVEIAIMKKKIDDYQSGGNITLMQMMARVIEEKAIRGEDVLTPTNHSRLFSTYGDVRMNDINYEWINGFINDHMKRGVSRNSINSYLSTIKAAYRRAQLIESLRVKPDNPFARFNLSLRTRVKRKEITIESFRAILDGSLTTDLLKFQVLIGGHDLADVACLGPDNFVGDRVVFRRFKNRNKVAGGPEVSNKFLSEAAQLWDKHNGFEKVPNPLVDHKRYTMFRVNHWRNISNRCKDAGVPRVGTKGPRYLFRTTAGNLGVDALAIMTIQGHAPQGMTFVYQLGMDVEVLDGALRRIADEILYG